jgi:hypothetical protein
VLPDDLETANTMAVKLQAAFRGNVTRKLIKA